MATLNYFLFRIKATPKNKDFGTVGDCAATVAVMEDNPQIALSRARLRVESANWEIVSVDLGIGVESNHQVPGANAELMSLFERAKKNGIACIYDLGKNGQFFN